MKRLFTWFTMTFFGQCKAKRKGVQCLLPEHIGRHKFKERK